MKCQQHATHGAYNMSCVISFDCFRCLAVVILKMHLCDISLGCFLCLFVITLMVFPGNTACDCFRCLVVLTYVDGFLLGLLCDQWSHRVSDSRSEQG